MRRSHEIFAARVTGRSFPSTHFQRYLSLTCYSSSPRQDPSRDHRAAASGAKPRTERARSIEPRARKHYWLVWAKIPVIDCQLTVDAFAEMGEGYEVWKAMHALVKGLSEIVVNSLPSFWRIAKSYLDGKFKKVGSLVCWLSL